MFGMAGFKDAQHDFIDPDIGGSQSGPGFGEQGDAPVGGGIPFVKQVGCRSAAAHQPGDAGEVDGHTIAGCLEMGEGSVEYPLFGP